MPTDYRWTDPVDGVEHYWNGGIGNWYCTIHNRVCSSAKPLTTDTILRRAASDLSVSDDTFVVLRQIAEGRRVEL